MFQKPVPVSSQPMPPPPQPQHQPPYPNQYTERIPTPNYDPHLSNKSTPIPSAPVGLHNSPQVQQQSTPLLFDPAILSSAPLSKAPPPPTSYHSAPFPPQQPPTFNQNDSDGENSSSESSVDSNPYTANHAYQQQTSQPTYYNNSAYQSSQYTNSPMRPSSSTKTRSKRGKGRRNHFQQPSHYTNESDGWATEDLTDMKETEFDFQANLERFDKQLVFNEIRQNDATLPSDRLVAFNKVQGGVVPNRPVASNGQVKYGHKEMVLQNQSSDWELSDDDLRESGFGDDDDQSFISDVLTAPPPPLTIRRMSRPQISSDYVKLIATNTKKTCLCTSPVQMVELERLMAESFGIPETILTENAGRSVSRLAIQSLGGTSRFSYGNHNSRPVVVAFVGNSKTGARALAAARHLANRQVRVLVLAVGCVEDSQHGGDEIHKEVKTQLKALESCKGTIVTRFEKFMGELNMIDSPHELIIDGLQGYQTTFEDLLDEDCATVRSCIEWANNRQKASVLSLDIPSGLDSATGIPSSTSIPHINAKWVLSCGLPLTGIKNAYLTGTVAPGDWTHYVVDVGFPRRSLQRGSLRRFGQMWFGADWLLPLEVVIE